MIDVELRPDDVQLLLASLKVAEVQYGNQQEWQAARAIGKLHQAIHYQVFTYGQMKEEK